MNLLQSPEDHRKATDLIEDLARQIETGERWDYPKDSASWKKGTGVLLSYAEAEFIHSLLMQLTNEGDNVHGTAVHGDLPG